MKMENVAPHHASRFLVIRGAQTALRLALPGFGSLVLGADPTCDVPIHEEGMPAKAAELFLDFDLGLQVFMPGAELLAHTAGGPGRAVSLAPGRTVDLNPQDRVRIGPIELSFAPAPQPNAGRHIWSRRYIEDRLQGLLSEDPRPTFGLLRLRIEHIEASRAESIMQQELGAGDVIGEYGQQEYAAIVIGAQARVRANIKALTQALQSDGATVKVGVATPDQSSAAPGLLEQAGLRLDASGSGTQAMFVAQAPAMQSVLRLVDQVSRTSAPVLVLGETGTGKDVLAQQIHERSERSTGPFVRVNCIDLPETFLDDAATNFLSQAAGGTVLLDQVGGLSARAQVTLGYLLEESKAREQDVRFIATSNGDLNAAVQSGEFRNDLYFRLNRVTLALPPLRERTQDILPLAEHFIAEICRESNRAAQPTLTRAAAAQLQSYPWPGNLRQLRNMLERAVLSTPDETMGVEQLPPEISGAVPNPAQPQPPTALGTPNKPTNLRDEIAALEKRRILEALEAYPTQTEAAKALGIPLRTFLNRLDALGIQRARKPTKD